MLVRIEEIILSLRGKTQVCQRVRSRSHHPVAATVNSQLEFLGVSRNVDGIILDVTKGDGIFCDLKGVKVSREWEFGQVRGGTAAPNYDVMTVTYHSSRTDPEQCRQSPATAN